MSSAGPRLFELLSRMRANVRSCMPGQRTDGAYGYRRIARRVGALRRRRADVDPLAVRTTFLQDLAAVKSMIEVRIF